jgi:hypothetical protein
MVTAPARLLTAANSSRLLLEMTSDEGAPLIYPRITEQEQTSLDSTCRKLRTFLLAGQRAPTEA